MISKNPLRRCPWGAAGSSTGVQHHDKESYASTKNATNDDHVCGRDGVLAAAASRVILWTAGSRANELPNGCSWRRCNSRTRSVKPG